MKKIILSILMVLSVFAFSQQKTKIETQQFSVKDKAVRVYTTAENSDLRISNTDILSFVELNQPTETQISVFVNPQKTFQNFLGIGGAITDASAEVFATLSKSKQQELLTAYYNSDKGIGYTLMRTNIHSCDFSSASYTYINEGDTTLKSFNIDHDRAFRIPMIKQAIAAAGGKITLFASPWSPPAFMKSNQNMLKGGTLLTEFYQPWALYYTKFIKAYEKEGIPIWGISIENEPMATQRWESCVYTAEEERDFLKNHLGPVMKKEGLGDKKIIVWDHNRDLMSQRANVIFSDPEASKYAWGMGFHWYETWTGGAPMFENVGKVNEAFPDKNLIFTEGCVERFDTKKYQLWANGERYGASMIHDFNNGTVGWTDWNILLDQNGGPNHVGNFCFAPIHADTRTNELIYTPSYYYIGHFSKFIRPNAKRISTTVSRSSLISTSFLNANGKMITVVMNQSKEKVIYNLCVGNQAAIITILPNAIQTLVY